MSLQATNLVISASHLPATFKGTPDAMFQEMVSRMRILSPTGTSFFVVSDLEPPGNFGPWLKSGTQWFVWNPETKRYQPLDISESETKWFTVSSTTPTTTTPPVWLKISDTASPISWNFYNGTTWVEFPFTIEDRSITQAKLDWKANFFGTASGIDNYSISFSPGTNFNLGDGAANTFFFIVKFSNANTGAVTLNVNGSGVKPVKKFTGENLVGGEIIAGSVHLLAFDGTGFQLISGLAPIKSGVVLSTATTVSDATANTAAFIPYDNTPPQNSEGAALNDLETDFTAQRAGSKLVIDIRICASADNGTDFVVSLFRDNEPNALGFSLTTINGTGSDQAVLRVILTGVDTLAHTYRIRFGSTRVGGATVYVNSTSTGVTLGGMDSSVIITEVSA